MVVQRDGGPQRKDFDADTRTILDVSTDVYEALLATECLFPDTATESRFVKTS